VTIKSPFFFSLRDEFIQCLLMCLIFSGVLIVFVIHSFVNLFSIFLNDFFVLKKILLFSCSQILLINVFEDFIFFNKLNF
jgi:hypothetical protein